MKSGKSIALLALTGLVFAASNATADYVAYSVHEKGRSPLPERLNKVDTKHLVNIEWGEFAGRKARLGVLPVDNTSSSPSFIVTSAYGTSEVSTGAGQVPVNGIEAMVISSLGDTNRFRLVERTELDKVTGEQDLVRSGRVAAPSGAATGNILGAEYLVQFVVTDYEEKTSGTDGGALGGLLSSSVPVLGGVKAGKSEGRVGMNMRLIDAETSEIIFSKQIEAQLKQTNFGVGGIAFGGGGALGGFLSKYSQTPIGQAVMAGINESVFELIKQVGSQPAQGSVIKADAAQIYVNLGSDSVNVGERLQVLRKGEELIDPDTGISLGAETSAMGEIEVATVNEKFSIARPVSVAGTLERGDQVKSTAPPAPLEFADKWKKPK